MPTAIPAQKVPCSLEVVAGRTSFRCTGGHSTEQPFRGGTQQIL